MRDPHVLAGLKEKRARLSGELVMAQMRVIALKADLAHIDGTLKIFYSDVDPKEIPPKITIGKNPAGLKKGVASRTALEILRETEGAMSSQELAACVLQRHGRPWNAVLSI